MKNICKQFIKDWVIEGDSVVYKTTKTQKEINKVMKEIYNMYKGNVKTWKIRADEVVKNWNNEVKIIRHKNPKGQNVVIRYFVENI